jgi:hypothetical protein
MYIREIPAPPVAVPFVSGLLAGFMLAMLAASVILSCV